MGEWRELLFLSEPTTPEGVAHLCKISGAKLLGKCFFFFFSIIRAVLWVHG